MKISMEELEKVILSLRSRDARENRRAPRLLLSTDVTILPNLDKSPSQTANARIRDISAEGICILFTASMRQGQVFGVRMPRQDQPPLIIRCVVKYCRELSFGSWQIGAVFEEVAAVKENDPRVMPSDDELRVIQRAILGD
jgi:hypothetical protein